MTQRITAPHDTQCPDGSSHHWVLSSPAGGRTVPGVCKKCKTVGEFRSAFELGSWQDQKEAAKERADAA